MAHPFATADTLRRLDARILADTLPIPLSASQLGLLRVLIARANYVTGEIPYNAVLLARLAGVSRSNVCRWRTLWADVGLLRVLWRSRDQVAYALGEWLRSAATAPQECYSSKQITIEQDAAAVDPAYIRTGDPAYKRAPRVSGPRPAAVIVANVARDEDAPTLQLGRRVVQRGPRDPQGLHDRV